MVLRPILDAEPTVRDDFIPAWSAVEHRQKQAARRWWLITQPDHAALSGEIAARIASPGFPRPDQEITRAIAMHDAGWSIFESDTAAVPELHPDGRPLSFFEVEARDFLRAWTASIDRAAEESARGGYMVSQHFTWLGEFRLSRDQDPPPVRDALQQFLTAERARQRDLRSAANHPQWDSFLPLLQFCDILSLYLCCGTRQSVEFPQQFACGKVRARYDADVCVLDPSPFQSQASLTFRARPYPATSDSSITLIHIAVQ